jgi:hypothetical protein
MTIDELIAKLEALPAKLEAGIPEILQEVALNGVALITNRIQQEGLPGKQQYSAKKVPAYLFLLDGGRKLDTEQTRAFVRSVVKRKQKEMRVTNWAEIREAHGNQSAFVDLTFTGMMWRGVTVLSNEQQGALFRVVVGGINAEVQKKLKWNAERYGNFFALTEEETRLLTDLFSTRLRTLLETALS